MDLGSAVVRGRLVLAGGYLTFILKHFPRRAIQLSPADLPHHTSPPLRYLPFWVGFRTRFPTVLFPSADSVAGVTPTPHATTTTPPHWDGYPAHLRATYHTCSCGHQVRCRTAWHVFTPPPQHFLPLLVPATPAATVRDTRRTRTLHTYGLFLHYWTPHCYLPHLRSAFLRHAT